MEASEAKGTSPSESMPQAIIRAHAKQEMMEINPNSINFLGLLMLGVLSLLEKIPSLPHNLYGRYARKKLPIKPKTEPILKVPKKSPIRLPIAVPHAPAGPKRSPNSTGNILAGRISVKPGIKGMDLKGIRPIRYTAAQIIVRAIM